MNQDTIQYIGTDQLPFYMQAYAPTIFDEFAIVAYNEKGWFSENQLYVCLIPNTEENLELFRNHLNKLLSTPTIDLRQYCVCIPGRGGWYTGWKDWCRSSQMYDITVRAFAERYLIEFRHNESFGNFEYGGGYRECKYSISIDREYFRDPKYRQINHYITSDETLIQEIEPH